MCIRDRPLLAACDIYRPAAIKQLEVVGGQLDIPVFQMGQTDPVDIARAAIEHARQHGNDMVFLDKMCIRDSGEIGNGDEGEQDAQVLLEFLCALEIVACDGAVSYTHLDVYKRQRHPRDKKEIGISAVRGGTIVGEHEIIFAGHDEVMEIRHTALSREIFAQGAVEAAKFMAGVKAPGLYDMSSLIR